MHELECADLPRPLRVDHPDPGLADDDEIAGLDLRDRGAERSLLLLVDHDVTVHLDMFDRQPFAPVFDEGRVGGRRIEPFRDDPVALCRYKGDVADLGSACAEAVQFGEDGVELPLGVRRHTQPCITRVRLLLPDVEREDLEFPSHIHDPVKNKGHNAGIDDMALQFDFPAEFHI